MSKVEISHPKYGKRMVARSTLGTWRRDGWVLASDAVKPKNHLISLGESKKKEDAPASPKKESEGVAHGSLDSE